MLLKIKTKYILFNLQAKYFLLITTPSWEWERELCVMVCYITTQCWDYISTSYNPFRIWIPWEGVSGLFIFNYICEQPHPKILPKHDSDYSIHCFLYPAHFLPLPQFNGGHHEAIWNNRFGGKATPQSDYLCCWPGSYLEESI